MPGGKERALRSRIRSVEATKKITRAMELIAASRIVKAQQRVQQAVPYSEAITDVVRDLAAAGGSIESPLLVPRPEIRRVCHVVVGADRGLCGAYNAQLIRAAEGEVKDDLERGQDYSLVLVGRKLERYFRFRGYTIDSVHTGFSERPTYDDAKAIATKVRELFDAERVDAVQLIYTRFVSAGSQEVLKRPLIPLDAQLLQGGDAKPAAAEGEGAAEYEFEPAPQVILAELLPRYVEARIYAALLNAAASENAFRQRAMKSATDNAEDLIKTLRRVMNRARQDAITTEIMEVVGGAEALASDKKRDRHEPEHPLEDRRLQLSA